MEFDRYCAWLDGRAQRIDARTGFYAHMCGAQTCVPASLHRGHEYILCGSFVLLLIESNRRLTESGVHPFAPLHRVIPIHSMTENKTENDEHARAQPNTSYLRFSSVSHHG